MALKRAALLIGYFLITGCYTNLVTRSTDYPSPPDRFEQDIEKFEQEDAKAMPPQNLVLCVGSSSIEMWHSNLSKDLAPLNVIGRGFGGSNTNDLLHYADRIIIKYKPRAILIYEGDNDIAEGVKPIAIVATHILLLDKIERDLPGCRVYLLSIKPSIERWEMWPKTSQVNEALAKLAEDRKTVTYIDIATPMLGTDGKPRPDLFIEDKLHMNRKGYELWRDTIRPILVEAERKYEKP